MNYSSEENALNGGNSWGLHPFETIETDCESACETFFHRLLATRRVSRGGGTEFFEMDSEDHMRRTIELFRQMAATRESAKRAVANFEKVQCNGVLLEPTAGDSELSSKIRAIDARLIEIEAETEYLRFEREVIESQLKQRIGGSRGIKGIATWESKTTERFSEELLRERDPDLYERLLEQFHCLDTASWRKQQLKQYNQIKNMYFTTSVARKFEIVINTDCEATFTKPSW